MDMSHVASRATVRKVRHDPSDVTKVEFEDLIISNVDLGQLEEELVEMATREEEWLWEMPDMKFDVPPTDAERQ